MNKKTTVAFLVAFSCLALGMTVYAVSDNAGGLSAKKQCTANDYSAGNCVVKATPTPVWNAACMKTAVEKRENALITAVEKHSTTVLTALKNRKAGLLKAWDITDTAKRRAAIYVADKEYRNTLFKSRKELNEARKKAWKTFKEEKSKCKGVDDMTTENSDTNI